MGNKLTVYNQLSSKPEDCFLALKREIGLKTSNIIFANKLIAAMKDLDLEVENEQIYAANILLSGLQTLAQGGITPDDYDKIDFVKRGKTISVSARVEAFLRAAARKGYRIICDIIAVPQEDSETTYYKEGFYDRDIVYELEDLRKNSDRHITAQRLIDRYFAKFICRLDIKEISTNKRVQMTSCEMDIEELITIASSSEQGIYKSQWENYTNKWGETKRRKVITKEINSPDVFWVKWTGEMVKKTVLRRALKQVKEVLPELHRSILAFEQDEYSPETENPTRIITEPIIDVQIKAENVKLDSLTVKEVNINIPKNLAKVENPEFWKFGASTWHKLVLSYIPFKNGVHAESVKTKGEKTYGELEYFAPGSHYLYEGKLMVDPNTGSSWAKEGVRKVYTNIDLKFSKSPHKKATAHWSERAELTQKSKLINSMQRYADSGRLNLSE